MSFPVVGAAMPVQAIETHRDWLLEKQRDIELQSFHNASVLDGDWQPLVDKAIQLLDGHTGRRGIHGPFIGLNLASADPEIQKVVARRMDQALTICTALRADQMVIHSPYTQWDHKNFRNFIDSRQRIIDAVQATIGQATKRAEELGVTLVLENINDVDPSERLRLIEALGSPALALSLDTGHAHISHTVQQAEPVDYFVQAAGNRLSHVHLQDTDGYADRHWPLGEGSIKWKAVFAEISKLESNPRLIIELMDHNGIPASMRYLMDAGLAQ